MSEEDLSKIYIMSYNSWCTLYIREIWDSLLNKIV